MLAVDFVLPMLERGRAKLAAWPAWLAGADALQLPLRDASVSGAMVGFGMRNLGSLEVGLHELARVLTPGAPLVVLEFATPSARVLRALYLLYFRRILPLVGRLVSRHGSAYAYLPASVLEFPAPAEFNSRRLPSSRGESAPLVSAM